jgi:hypothetical protein
VPALVVSHTDIQAIKKLKDIEKSTISSLALSLEL